MKRIAPVVLSVLLLLSLASCAASSSAPASTQPVVTTQAPAPEVKSEGVITYEQYMSEPLEVRVQVESYVQAKESLRDGRATVYTQDQDGAYLVLEAVCSASDYEKLVPGQKVSVTGYKTVVAGQVQIVDGSIRPVQGGSFVAEPVDLTDSLSSEDIADYQNCLARFCGMTVTAAGRDANGKELPYLYGRDNTGSEGDDLYFQVSTGGRTYTFMVASGLCGADSEVYKAVQGLKLGDQIDAEGFLCWDEDVCPRITSIAEAK